MKASLAHKLYCEPWYIRAESHVSLCQQLEDPAAVETFGESFAEWVESRLPRAEEVGDVAIVPVHGPIMKGVDDVLKAIYGIADVDDVMDMLADCGRRKKQIRGVVLDINSPGGVVTGVREVADEVAALNEQVPVMAFTDDLMASAAYFIAAGAEEIVTTKSAQVGSVGTYLAVLDARDYFERAGVKTEVFKSGKYKGMGALGTSLTEEQRTFLQAMVDEAGADFRGFVTEHRGIAPRHLEGQVYWGARAVGLGFADDIGDRDDAMLQMRQLIRERE